MHLPSFNDGSSSFNDGCGTLGCFVHSNHSPTACPCHQVEQIDLISPVTNLCIIYATLPLRYLNLGTCAVHHACSCLVCVLMSKYATFQLQTSLILNSCMSMTVTVHALVQGFFVLPTPSSLAYRLACATLQHVKLNQKLALETSRNDFSST